MKLPKSFISVIKKHGVSEEDIIFTAVADFDSEYRFADSVVALTKRQLIYAAYPYREKVEYRFGGYAGWQISEDAVLAEEPALQIFDLERVEKLEVIREVGTGVLMAVIDGKERNLCHFSNTRLEVFLRLGRILGKIKEGEEIRPEDLDVKKGRECCPKCGMLYPDQERKVCPKCMDKKSILLRVISYFKPYKLSLAVMVLCYLGTVALDLVWPYLSGTVLYDRVLARDDAFLRMLRLPAGRYVTALIMLVIAMIVTKIAMQALGILQGVLTARIAPEVVAKLKSQVFSSMGRLSVSFYSRRQTGGLMTRVSDDAEEISSFFIDGIPYFFINVGKLLATCVIMFLLSPLLALVSILFMPLLVIVSLHMTPHLWHYYGKRHRANRRLNSQMNENFTGARVVRAFGQEAQEMTRFDKSNKRVRGAELDLVKYDNKFFALYCSVEDIIGFLVWAVGGALIISGSHIEVGMLLTFSGYVGQMKGPLEFMSRIIRWYSNCMNSAQRMFEIIDAVPEVKEAAQPLRPERLRGEIELKNVTFSYDAHKPILKDVSFHVNAGEVFGIVGRSGSGKSTLVNLISRLWKNFSGQLNPPALRCGRGRSAGRRRQRKAVRIPGTSQKCGDGVSGDLYFHGHRSGKHRLRKAGGHEGRDRARGGSGQRPRFYLPDAGRVRYASGILQPVAVGRREAEDFHRQSHSGGSKDPDSGRGHVGGGHGDGAGYPEIPGKTGERADGAFHRPQAVHASQRHPSDRAG